MPGNTRICAVAYAVLAASLSVNTLTAKHHECHEHASEPHDAWMMQNYRFIGPPPPGSVAPVDPVVSDLRQIQYNLLSVMRQAKLDYDYEASLAAAQQAAANAQVIGVITERLKSAAAPLPAAKPAPDQTELSGPAYSIALKDHTVLFATVYWSDGLMLHFLTRQGAHVQIRLDLVDLDLSVKLNHERNLEFKLAQ
jgi:hypothetical protein